jgi:superfamily II DNA or RNA helicase
VPSATKVQPSQAFPEVGQLVRARDRYWVVSDVSRGALVDVAAPGVVGPSHLIQLSSVEDDGFGEELKVFWEVEPGTVVLPKATLPRPVAGQFDAPDRLAAFLDAVRWGAIASADARALQAPFRSGITIEDYQLDPVVRALQMPRVNLLIADDVGLGKTIEAGLVVQELLLRHRAHTVLVVCPASICLKWQQEMLDRFGLEFRIVDSAAVKQLRRDRGVSANIWTHFPRLIVSLDWLKGPRAMALLDEVLPHGEPMYPRRFDLLVVDEVHQCAPAGRGMYATDSLRTKAIQKIAPHFEHRLFLSATPHNGYSESYTALLQLLDPQRFFRRVPPTQDALQRAVVRRMKSELRETLPPRADGSPRFAKRDVLPLEVEYPPEERRIHDVLRVYTESRRRQAQSTVARNATDFVTILLKKRLFSSPKAFLETLQQHLRTLQLQRTRRAASPPLPILRAEFDRLDEDEDDDERLSERTGDALDVAARAMDVVTPEQEAMLAEMLAWARREAHRPDAKTRVLMQWLDATCRPDGHWNDERVIVFTEYRDTQVWLQHLLTQHGLGGDRLALLHGNMETDKRERVKAEFQAPPGRAPVRILLATDAASEGIDLQLQCHRMVHVEIPFSPSRLEQRNGRIDRHGQPSKVVEIFHFVGTGYELAAPGSIEADLDFLSRIARKVETIRDDLGTAGPVLAAQVEEAMLGRRTLLDERPLADAAQRAKRTALKLERNLRAEIARLRDQLDSSITELGISPEASRRVVETALSLAWQPPLQPLVNRPGYFRVGALSNAWARAKIGLHDPLSGEERPITFDHGQAAADRDVVLAHLGHRLVTQATSLLRAEIWKSGGERALQRVSAAFARPGALDEVTVIAHARLVVTSTDGHRLHEEIITAGGSVRRGRFLRLAVGQVREALAAATPDAVPDVRQAGLIADWDGIEDPLLRALDQRADDVTQGLQKRLAERAERDVEGIAAVLDDLRRNIEVELARCEGDEGQQLRLQFGSDEESTQQFERDVMALRERLLQIPGEIAREQEEIRRRYASPQARVFPAAVTILVPREVA